MTKKDLMDKYLDVFNNYSWNNETFGKLTFHTILGQVLKNKKIPKGGLLLDPRISIFLVQDSGSGKSTAYECVTRLIDQLGYKHMSMNEPNDAALIGTQEESEVTDDDGEKRKEWNATSGALSWADMILVDEGIVLLRPKKHGKDVLVILQTALNPIGSESNKYEKHMAHGDPIYIQPHCSLIVTSIMPPGLDSVALTGGFLQRILLFPRWLTDEDRIRNALTDIELLGIARKTKKKMNNIVKEFEEIRDYYENNDIIFPERVKPFIKQLVKKLFKNIEKSDVNIKPILLTFLSRYQNFMYVLAYHYCAMDMRTEVSTDDLRRAYDLINTVFGEIAFWLESTLKTSKLETKIRSYKIKMLKLFAEDKHKKDGDKKYIPRAKFVKLLAKRLRVSKPTARNYLKEFIKRGILEEKNRKVYLKENGK
jgi:hypothetical protein